MKLYLKVIGCSCYTCLPRSSPAAAQTAQKMGAPGTRPKAQRLLTIATPKYGPAHTQTCKQGQKIRNSTTLHKNSTQNYARTILSTTLHKNSTQNYARTILRITTITWAQESPTTELRREF
jgi:hypothetical protein